MTTPLSLSARILAYVLVGLTFLTRFNKLLGALAGGGLITLLVTLHVIPASIGNALIAVVTALGAGLGTFLAAANKALSREPLPTHEIEQADVAAPDPGFGVVDEVAEQAVSGGTAVAADADRPLPHHAQHAAPDA